MRVALAQINSHLGDFSQNREKILEFTQKALRKKCDLVVFPELALFGYLPGDLLERESIVEAQLKEFERLQSDIPDGIGVIVGLVTRSSKGKPFFNTAAFLEKGKKPKFFNKQLLPTYDIFDETRFYESGDVTKNILKFKSKKILVTICEDIWGWGQEWRGANYLTNPIKKIKKVDLVINLSGSPFSKNKRQSRLESITKTVQHLRAPLAYVNLVGAEDEVIFDGGSLAVDKKGEILAESAYFKEDFCFVDFDGAAQKQSEKENKWRDVETLRAALVLGIRDFARKNGFEKIHLGLSGGIDSAVALCLAVEAMGARKVTSVALPGPFSATESLSLAKKLCQNLKSPFKEISILNPYESVVKALEKSRGPIKFGVTHENLQARLRGLTLMAFANLDHSLLLTTSNKSELASGYSTLYGDMCGGLAPLGDLLKRDVYALAELYNRKKRVIPKEIIERAPTAELRPNQKDQDTLPPYDILDRAVEQIVERARPAKSRDEKWLVKAMFRSEFKRWQAPPILRVTSHAFGRGRRVPITNKALF